LLYVSSGAVYHPENSSEYALNKLAWEQECLVSGVDIVIARLFTFEDAPGHAFAEFTKAAKTNKPIRIWGNGKAIRSYMNGNEMSKWLWAILLHGKSREAYDVGSDVPITLYELAAKIKVKYNSTSEIIIEDRIPDPMPIYLPENTKKTRDLLNV
jgi:nucleoside-diphosphate-sugar epimerase